MPAHDWQVGPWCCDLLWPVSGDWSHHKLVSRRSLAIVRSVKKVARSVMKVHRHIMKVGFVLCASATLWRNFADFSLLRNLGLSHQVTVSFPRSSFRG